MSKSQFNVLLVEDNPGDARLIEESLAEVAGDSFRLENANRLAAALSRLREGNVDATLLDLALPDSSGQETFRKAKAEAPQVPIIVLTGLGDEALAVKMVQEGAQDYLVKVDLNGNVLSRAIRYAIERAAAEHQIKRLNVELEQKVRERTADLEAANRELEAFSYSVSHDLRAPLRQISGFAAILAQQVGPKLDAEGHQHLGLIRQGAERMGQLIDALLEMGRMGKKQVERKATDLNSVVQSVIRDLGPELQGRRVELRIGILPTVECDPDLIRCVFANLLSNAVKYTRHKEIAIIEVGLTMVETAEAIFVRDNGAGFDPKYADKLFQVFQRLHLAEDFEGTGVGLATVQRILQKHGWRIWAEAEVNQGASFFFSLKPAHETAIGAGA